MGEFDARSSGTAVGTSCVGAAALDDDDRVVEKGDSLGRTCLGGGTENARMIFFFTSDLVWFRDAFHECRPVQDCCLENVDVPRCALTRIDERKLGHRKAHMMDGRCNDVLIRSCMANHLHA